MVTTHVVIEADPYRLLVNIHRIITTRRKRGGAALLSLLVLGVATPASAATKSTKAQPGLAGASASGTVMVNGKLTTIRFGYARQVVGFFDPTKNDIEVVLSDVALTGSALTEGSARSTLARSGKAHIFEITIDADGKPVSTSFHHAGFTGPSPSGLDSTDVFTKQNITATAVGARYQSSAAHEFFGTTYTFDVTFRLPITARGK